MPKSKGLHALLITLLFTFTFSGCTAWPAVAALLGLGGGKSGGGMLIIPPGGSESGPNQGVQPVSSEIILTTTTSSRYYGAGSVIEISVKFSEPVDVTGIPKLRLNNLVDVNYLSGSGSDTLVFRYTVQSGNNEDVIGLETASQTALSLNGGTIKSTANSKNMSLTLPVPGSVNSFGNGKVIVIDTIVPTITNVTSTTTNGIYGIGGTVSIEVEFSEAVNVIGTPQILLETGGVDRLVDCTTGFGTTRLSCLYTIQSGDMSTDLDYVDVNSFSLNGSTVKDGALNDATLTLVAPGVAGSLGFNSDIVVNTSFPSVSFSVSSSSGLESVSSVTLTVDISFSPLSGDVSVPYSVTGGTASGGSDYTLASGTLSYIIGDGTSKTITLNVSDDILDENNETVIVTLGTPTNGSLGSNPSYTYTILDNDTAPSVSFDLSGSSGNESATNVTIPVSLSTASGLVVSVDYSVSGGTATGSGTDYTITSGTLTFAAGITTQNINFAVTNDSVNELDETVIVTISNPGNSSLGSTVNHTYTITNDDPIPSVAFDLSSSNGSETVTNVLLPVSLSSVSAQTVTVNYSVTGGSATGGGTDYTLTSGILTFPAGTTTQNINLTVTNDTLGESNETIVVSLSNAGNSSIGANSTHTYTINDNDATTVAFSSASSSGSEGISAVNLGVTLSNANSSVVSVDYAVSGGTATGSGTDYTLASGTLTFNAGVTSQNISLTIVNDTMNETDETILVTLSNPTVATLGTNITHTYTINDNDTAPILSIDSPTVAEGNSGTTTLTYTVTLSAVSGNTVSVNYSTSNGTATTADNDYIAIASTGLTFTPGQTTKTIDVTINGDTKDEPNETVIVTLTTPTNATILSAIGTGTITNDDTAPTLSIDSPTVAEGNSGTTTLTYTVTLSAASGNTVSVNYSTSNGTATTADNDYIAIPSTGLTFTPGQTSKTIDVTINGDAKDEPNETVTVTLTTPTNATIVSGNGTGTITNDDTAPTLSISSPSVTEGNSGTKALTYTVTLSAVSGNTVTVDYATVDGTATIADNDYVAIGATTLTFTAGQTSKTFDVTINGDAKDETNETVVVTLSSPTNATILSGTGTGTITNDDTAPTVAFTTTTSNGSEATTSVTIPVTLSAVSGKSITVDYAVTGGTATGAGTDYTLTSGTLTFSAGVTSQNISVTVVNDTVTELNETMIVTLSNPVSSTLGGNIAHTYTINDDDPPTVAFSSTNSNALESVTAVTIPVSLSAAYANTVTVDYAVTGGTATGSGTDYTLTSGTLTFASGTTSQNISINVVNDTATEVDETIMITLSNPVSSTLGGNITHTYTINDNDPPSVAFSVTSSNGSEASTAVTIPVTLSGPRSTSVTVDYAVTGGTATGGGGDFTLASGTLTFAAGVTSQDIALTVVNDTATELNETIIVTLSNPTNASLGGNSVHTYTINDDDLPTVAFDATGSSGVESTTSVTIPVSLSGVTSVTVTVDYAVTSGTATGSGTDYTLTSGTLTFVSGVTTQNITMAVVNDTATELNETVVVTLSNPVSATLGGNTSHTYTINDNDPPIVTFNTGSSNASESITSVTIPVTLSGADANSVTVDYAVSGGTATGNGTDYTLNSGTLVFNSGETSKDITFAVVNDSLYESGETIVVDISNPSIATLGAITSHTYTINDDDTAPTVQFAQSTSNSGDESSLTRTVAVSLSAAAGQDITVVVTDITGPGAGLAISGLDYTAIGSPLTVTIPAGSTTQNIGIPITQDLEFEGNETIQLSLSSPTNATLGAIVGHTFTIIDDDAGILSAETMDLDNNGKIDHYKITFSEPVQDSTFPGYASNALGSAQVNWRIGGTSTGVVLSQGNAEPTLGDVANDEVMYLKFDESGIYDTDSKPEVTTSGNPSLLTVSSKTMGVVYTATVTEIDRAKPVVVTASGTTASSNVTVSFSEPVWGAINMPACGAGGNLNASSLTYIDVSGNGSSSLTGMGADSCGTDSTAIFTANTAFLSTDNGVDTVAGNNNLYDAANNVGNARTKVITITDPIITSIEQYDTNKNGKIDQIKLVFSINMNDGTIDDIDANLFVVGGSVVTKVDTVSGGTGIIVSPNNDPGIANDNIVTLFTDDSSVSGTDLKSVSFTTNVGRWRGNNGVELQSIASLSSIAIDKAPPVILTAVASDNTNLVTGVDSDDTLVLTFSEFTNKPVINTANISTIFSLNNGHVWGTITSATWNASGDMLTLLFAGSGNTVAVGDMITILGTVADTAASPNTSNNIPAVNPITGTFFTVDTSTPTVVSATSINATTVRVTYSKAMNISDATTTGNYKIVVSPGTGLCSDNTNFTAGTVAITVSAVTQVDTKTFDLTTAPQSATSYTLLVNKTGVNDFQPVNLSCPNNADFTGNEDIKISAASCANTTEIVYTFSKPVKSGMNSANSAECNSTLECAKRYYITPATLGSITSVKALDGIICGGAAINESKVCITHTIVQGGGNYTVISANNVDGDGFDNTYWGAIQNSTAPIANIQVSPKDRASFTGCGAGIHNFVDGPISTDPFGDNAYFGYVMGYFNKIYVGPNTKGNAASRFNPDGSNPDTMSFEFTKDTNTANASGTSSNSATTRDGSIAVPPYVTIGHTGCTSSSADIASGCGPNNENGRGLFASGVISGTEYLFITGGRSGGYGNYLYYTSDTDTVLNFKYLDARDVFNGDGGVQMNKGTESIIVFNGKVYWMAPGDGTYRPYLAKLNNLNQDQLGGTDGIYLQMKRMSGFGYDAASRNGADKVGGTLFGYNDRLYLANSGSNSVDNASTCDANSPYTAGTTSTMYGSITTSGTTTQRRTISNLSSTAGLTTGMNVFGNGIASGATITSIPNSTTVVISSNAILTGTQLINFLNTSTNPCMQTGGIIRSTNNDPAACTAANACGNWIDITPTATKFRQYFSIVLLKLADLIPAERPIPGFESFNSKIYMIRNACTTRVQKIGSSNDIVCPDGNEIPQLWKCDPTNGGSDVTNPTTCEAGEWSLVAENGSSGKTNMNMSTNKEISILTKNGSQLYIGYDNATTGAQIWRTKSGVTDPISESDFEQIGANGFGDPSNNLELYSSVSLEQSGSFYMYVTTGRPGSTPVQPLRIYRQVNAGPLALLGNDSMSELLAYINHEDNTPYTRGLIILILIISGYLIFKKTIRKKSYEE
ncbi:MAG: hypothetical protein IPL26_15530 [Leptospiraceae bacterium]|nr:hypothetical protein [Leptospiraceae bacterium]